MARPRPPRRPPPAAIPLPAPRRPPPTAAEGAGTAGVLRRCLLALVLLAAAGAAIELALLRHWHSPLQLVPWFALAAVAVGAGVLAGRPSPRAVRAVRGLALAVALCAAVGVYAHVAANYDAGPLDQRYTATWATLPLAARWWAALTLTVGPAPPIAPGVLAQAALGLLFATVRHPALDPTRPRAADA